jgi:hypothetical protein
MAIGLAISFVLLLTLVRKLAPRYGFAGIATLVSLCLGAYFSCDRLRHEALRGIQFSPFLNENGDFAAGYDLSKYKPVVISDWPWSERACPPNTGAVTGTVRGRDGRAVRGANVYVDLADGPAMRLIPQTETDAQGHFAFHGLHFGHYWVGAFMGSYYPRDGLVKITLGPTSRVKMVELRQIFYSWRRAVAVTC